MPLPSLLYQGDAASWTDRTVPAGATAVTVWLRTDATANNAASVEGVLVGGLWTFSLAGEVTATWTPGEWAVQFVAELPAGPSTYRPIARITVRQSLLFGETASALDPRSPSEVELAELRVAIRAVYRSAEYRIGSATGQRMLKRADLPWLLERERELMRRVANEKRAAAGGGPRRVLTHFVNS
jgi:hypothetical protein